jgi:ATP-binding cassette subfamily B protein
MTDASPLPATPPLAAGECLLARHRLDLDAQGRFADGELCLTDRRLLARDAGTTGWQSWPLDPAATPGLKLQHADQGGLARLSLHDEHRRLAHWHFTLAGNPAALKLVNQFER